MAVERYSPLQSKISADRAENRARRAEAELREAKAVRELEQVESAPVPGNAVPKDLGDRRALRDYLSLRSARRLGGLVGPSTDAEVVRAVLPTCLGARGVATRTSRDDRTIMPMWRCTPT